MVCFDSLWEHIRYSALPNSIIIDPLGASLPPKAAAKMSNIGRIAGFRYLLVLYGVTRVTCVACLLSVD